MTSCDSFGKLGLDEERIFWQDSQKAYLVGISHNVVHFAFLFYFRNELTDDNTIDLHGLHVTEAIEALENMLSERIGTFSKEMWSWFIAKKTYYASYI